MRAHTLLVRILASLTPPADRHELTTDLEAELARRRRAHGRVQASAWLLWQAARSAPALLAHSIARAHNGFDANANMMNPGGVGLERWLLETRYALRRLRRRPAYAALAVTTLGVGVGGLAAIAGIARPLLVDALPYPHAEQLAEFWRPSDWRGREVTALRPTWTAAGFAAVAAFRQADVTLEREGEPARLVAGLSATTELFTVLGVAPVLGRGFAPGEDAPNAPPVAVLSFDVWRQLGSDETLIGKVLTLDGKARTVIGVMPQGFWFPDPSVGVWTADSLAADGGVGLYTLIGRVAPGHRVDRMEPGIARVTELLASRFTYSPGWDITKNAVLTPILDAMVGSMRPMLFATAAGMLVILLIACANVSALVLGQVESRSTEFALRTALGANRGRIAAQIVLELVAIGTLAGIVAGAIASIGFRVLQSALPLGAWRERASLDWRTFVVALGVALASALVISLLPLLTLRTRAPNATLAGARTGGIPRRGFQGPMIVGEVALAVLLTCAAGLLMRSVGRLYAVRTGIDTHGVIVLDVALPNGITPVDRRRMMSDMLGAVEAIPGVSLAATTQRLPLRGRGWTMGLRIPDAPADAPTPNFRMVSRDYFKALRIPLVRGRLFNTTDRETDTLASIVVNEALVKTFFANSEPIGRVMPGGFGRSEQIVGVVGNVAETSLRDPMPPARYYLADQVSFIPGAQTIVARIERESDAPRVLRDARRGLAAATPHVAIQNATTMEHVLDRAVGPARDMMSLLTLLTALAVVLGAVGIYGVISQFVARRTREWSIRVALGLSPMRVLGLIMRHSVSLALLGVCVGTGSAILLARFLSTFLFGVTAHDAVSFAVAAILLLVVGAVAALLPALRAGHSDPALALRAE